MDRTLYCDRASLSPSTGISGYNKLPGVKDSGIKSASDWLSGLKHVTLY